MRCVCSKVTILTALTVILTGLSSQAGKIDKNPKPPDIRAALLQRQALAFSIPAPGPAFGTTSTVTRIPLGTTGYDISQDGSPGITVGWTYADWQHIGSMGRMIETGPHSGYTGETIVHMGWMFMPDSVSEAGRYYMYNAYKSADNTFAGACLVSDLDENGGYVNVDVTPDNRALVGGHCAQKGPIEYQAQIYFDFGPAAEIFNYYVRVPDSLSSYSQTSGDEACWPKFFFQFGNDTVLHVAAQINDPTASLQALMYYRRVGAERSTSAEWDFPPYVVDSVTNIAHDITGLRQGNRVAISWMASLPYQQPECDTCSGFSAYGENTYGLMDNDLYYQVSEDQGATWEPRVNVTGCEIGGECFKPFADLSMLFDQSDNLHIVWTACPWPADPCVMYETPCFEDEFWGMAGRLVHWSENYPYQQTICDHTQGPVDSCGPPVWALRVAKPTISGCDNKLYAIWTQFNSIEEGVYDDCARWALEGNMYWGGANGELWVAGSADGGMTWSNQHNLTNSYTPNCDYYSGYDCQHDYWASMPRYGRETQAGEDWSFIPVVDPIGGTITDYYLDVQYMNGLQAGAELNELVNSPMKWFRMPCFEPDPCGPFCPWVTPTEIGYPTYARAGLETQVPVTIRNDNCYAIDYACSIEEDNGPAGWLGVSGLSGTVPSGPGTTETGEILLNKDGIIVDRGWYFGRVNFEFLYLGASFLNGVCDGSIEVQLLVEDTVIPPTWDTVNTSCLALTASTNGNMGRSGLEKVNMDYYPQDCDSTATIYMYEGSPFVGRILDGDTVFSSAIWRVNYWSAGGLRPQGGQSASEYCEVLDAEVFESGTFTTADSAVAFEKIWVAPQTSCPFIIEYTRIWSYGGTALNELLLGEVIDWDVPWDYLADDEHMDRVAINTGYIDGPRGMVYQRGYDAHGAGSDTGYPYNCQYNDERFAGNAFVESYLNGSLRYGIPYGGFLGENDRLVYPATEGFVPGLFYQEAIMSGLRGSDSTEDIFAAMTFEPPMDLGGDDVYEVVTVLATVEQGTLTDLQAAIDAGKAWYNAHGGMGIFADEDGDGRMDICPSGCCVIRGDFNHDGSLNPLDAVAFVNWLWKGGPGPVCCAEMDLNCDCAVTPADVLPLVRYLWFVEPLTCSPCSLECWQGWYGTCP